MSDTNSNMSPQERFEHSIADQVRQKIGDLIPEDVLVEHVRKVLHKVFFEERVVQRGGYNQKDVVEPPRIHEVIHELLKDRVHAVVSKFVLDNPDLIERVIKEVVEAGLASTIVQRLDAVISGRMWDPINEINNRLTSLETR